MPALVEFSIPLAEYMAIENEVLRQVTLMGKLRNAGMPVVGSICIERCETGTLSITYDDLFQTVNYRWVP